MALTSITQDLVALERGWIFVHCTLTVGATGAVSAVSGKRFNSGAASGENGGIVRDGTGVYTITLPGRGGLQEIFPLAPVIVDGDAADVRLTLCTDRTVSARTVEWTFLDADTPAATDPANGSVIEFGFLVRQSSVS